MAFSQGSLAKQAYWILAAWLHIQCYLKIVHEISNAHLFVQTGKLPGFTPVHYLGFSPRPNQGPLGPMGLCPVGIACSGLSVSPSEAPLALKWTMTIKTALQRQRFPTPVLNAWLNTFKQQCKLLITLQLLITAKMFFSKLFNFSLIMLINKRFLL